MSSVEQKTTHTALKRKVEGNNTNHNSFSILSNMEIIDIAGNMGIKVGVSDYDKVELIKDLENARQPLHDKISKNHKNVDEEEDNNAKGRTDPSQLLLEWTNEDSEEENFVLVESKKKKREKKKLAASVKFSPRRSKRTAPSIYRNRGQQENLVVIVSDRQTKKDRK